MRRFLAAAVTVLALVGASLVVAGCGEEEHSESREGEPLELGELSYNVQITRFLNPDDVEDAEYLVGQAPPKPGNEYLGVFMVVSNETEEALPSADTYVVRDTLENEYEPLETETPYALDVGAEVPAEGQLPIPDSTAATGPNQGSLLVFEVSEEVSDNRPLRLEIDGPEEAGEITLDI